MKKNYLLQVIGNNVKCHDEEVVTPVPKAAIPAPEMYAAQNSSIPHETAFAILFYKIRFTFGYGFAKLCKKLSRMPPTPEK